MTIPGYNGTELLATVASRILQNGDSVFVGTGLPVIAGMLAQKTHAPELLVFFEAGAIGPQVPQLPISVGDSRTIHKAVAASSMHDLMSMCQSGYADYGFLGAAQLDPFGNINTTVIGDWDKPTARLPGSGGANDVGSFVHKMIIILRQSKRSFVPKVDFITTPGFLTGPGAREKAGLPSGGGPFRVITQLAVYDFNPATCRMRLFSLHPGVKVDDVRESAGFEIEIPESYGESPTPTADELRLLRDVIDPSGIVIGK
ncbi:MAG: 3-oxoacid CoA-transferase [Proteobacteria bacterium]|jgi:3-oxoacid CoA-transferase subunit B/glutaconate CoA-transferase subunit B|nr:3-oxoacid CoA-transferase [Pseudomonadota bacterium]